MQSFDIIKNIEPSDSFRATSIIGKFDLNPENYKEHFKSEFKLPDSWNIGLIVGYSGTGKTTIAKELFGDYFIKQNYNCKSVIDDMPENKNVDDICKMFCSVGFSSPPSWLKPYYVLSNGEKMRVDLAKSCLSDNEIIIFDEFTSVVDREVAKTCSFALQKSIRKQNKKFIAVSCHSDIEEWLEPDWIFNTNKMTFSTVKKKDQKLKLISEKDTIQNGGYLGNIII